MKITNYPFQNKFYSIEISKDQITITSEDDPSFVKEVHIRKQDEFYHKDFAKRISFESHVFMGIDGSFVYEALCAFEE